MSIIEAVCKWPEQKKNEMSAKARLRSEQFSWARAASETVAYLARVVDQSNGAATPANQY